MTDESVPRSRGERDLAYGRLIAPGLRPVSAGLAALYAGLSVGHVLLTHGPRRFLEESTAAILAAVFLGLHVRLRLRPIDPGRAQLLAGVAAFLALGESLGRLAIAGDPSHSANLRLLLVAVGAFLLSWPWVIAVLVSGILGWAVVAGARWDARWAENALTLVIAALLALVINLVRRRAVDALLEERRRFGALIEHSADLISILDAGGTILFESPSLATMLGYGPDELVGRNVMEFVHPADATQVAERTAETLATPGATTPPIVARFRHKDGTWRIVEAVGTNLLHDSAVGGIVVNSREVTERETLARKIREATERLTSIVLASPAAIVAMDPEGFVTMWNPAAEQIFGWTEQETLGRLVPWLPEEHAPDFGDFLQRVLAGESFTVEHTHRRRGGSPVEVRISAAPMRDADGLVIGLMTITEDITERLRAEEALREAEEKYRTLTEQIPAILYVDVPDPHGQMLYVSPQVEEILGVTSDDYVADVEMWSRMIHADDRDRVTGAYLRFLETGGVEPAEEEYRMIRPDGRVVWIHDRAAMVLRADGAPLVVQGVMFDVTERKEAEERLREAELQYRTLVERMPSVTYRDEVAEDREENPTPSYISSQIETLLGYTPDEWLADPEMWGSVVHPDDLERVETEGDRARVAGEPFSAEYRMIRKDGRPIWVQEESVLVWDKDGRPRYWQGTYADVTERREAEEALREAEERFRTLVEQLPAALYVDPLDENKPNLYVSPQIEDMLGASRDVFTSDSRWWENHLHPDDRERMPASFRRIVDTSITSEFVEYRIIRPDGKLVWIEDRSKTLFDDSGNAVALQGIMFDITAKKRGESLRDGQRQVLELIATGAPVEETLEALVGVAEEQTDGALCSVILLEGGERFRVGAAPGLPAEYVRMIEGAGAGPDSAPCAGAAFRGEPLIVDDVANDPAWEKSRDLALKHGIRACWSVPIAGLDGRPLGAFAVFVREARAPEVAELDVVEAVASLAAIAIQRRRDEEALRESLDSFRTLASQAPVGIFQSEAHGRGIWVNEHLCEITGRPAEELLGDGWMAAVHPDDRQRARAEWSRVWDEGAELHTEYRYLRPDGKVRWVAAAATPVLGGDGAMAGLLGTVTDITERKAVEEVLQKSEAELRHSLDALRRTDEERRKLLAHLVEIQEQERDRMAEGIEDDHLQQMTAVGMRLETLRRAVSDPEQLGALDHLGESVKEAVARMRSMLNELRPRELETGGLGPALRRYLDTVAEESGLEARVDDRLTVELSEEIRAAAFRIAQDAIRNVREHARASRVEVAVEDRDGGVFVRVVDDGCGFAMGEGDGPDRLGLAAMRERAELAGGWYRLRSAPGSGTTVEFWLPAEPADGDASVD